MLIQIRISAMRFLENPESPINIKELLDQIENLVNDERFISLNFGMSDESNGSGGDLEAGSELDAKFLSNSSIENPNFEETKNSSAKDATMSKKGDKNEKKSPVRKPHIPASLTLMPAPRIGLLLNQPKLANKKHFVRNFELGFNFLPSEEVTLHKHFQPIIF
jgi:hypothetical protein